MSKIPLNFGLHPIKVQCFLLLFFHEWLQYCASVQSVSSSAVIHKNKNKSKQTPTKTFWAQSGASGCQRLRKHTGSSEPKQHLSIQGSAWWSVKYEVLCGRAAGRIMWHILGSKPELALFQTLSFLSLKCQDLIHGKFGELAAVSEDFIELQCAGVTWMPGTLPRKRGFLSSRNQLAYKNVHGFDVVLE